MEASSTPAARARGALRGIADTRKLVLALGVIGGLLLILAELSTIVTVDVLTSGTCEELADTEVRDACSLSGLEQHKGALILLGLLAIAMAFGAGPGGSRPAAAALLVVAVAVLGIAILLDVPKASETGLVGIRYEDAKAGPDLGLYFEFAGALLVACAGALRLFRPHEPAAE